MATGGVKSPRAEERVDSLIHLRGTQNKLILAMVGLPGRGKSYIATKLCRYLNWLSYRARVFNVGVYRRKRAGMLNASFFDSKHEEGMQLRTLCYQAALGDMFDFFGDDGQAAIFDATNATEERRQMVIDAIRQHSARSGVECNLVWIESVCTDEALIDANLRELKLTSPDYSGRPPEEAAADFKARIAQYAKVYEPLPLAAPFSFVRILNGGQQVVANRISGYLPSRVVFFLMNLRIKWQPIYFSRHGQSMYNVRGLIGGDSSLSENGEEYARLLGEWVQNQADLWPAPASPSTATPATATAAFGSGSGLRGSSWPSGDGNSAATTTGPANRQSRPASLPDSPVTAQAQSEPQSWAPPPARQRLQVWTSTLRRTVQTAAHIPGARVVQWRGLREIEVGICDGMTYEEIERKYPEEFAMRKRNKLRYRYPHGESYLDVVDRLEPVIFELERAEGPVLVVGHRAVLRCLYSYFLDIEPDKIPHLDVPLHVVLRLTPKAYGCGESRFPLLPLDDDIVPAPAPSRPLAELDTEPDREPEPDSAAEAESGASLRQKRASVDLKPIVDSASRLSLHERDQMLT